MAQPIDYQIARIRDSAESLLADSFGGPVRLSEGTTLREASNVRRLDVLSAPPGTPSTVVVKTAGGQPGQAYDPDRAEAHTPAWRLFNDWAGLRLLGEVGLSPRLAPQLYGGDRAHGLLVEEDLGVQAGAEPLLLGQDAKAAEEELIELAKTLGTMHAMTIGKKADYDRILRSLNSSMADARLSYDWLRDILAEISRTLDIVPCVGTDAELDYLIAALENPGPFLAYNHGDPCPGNWARAGETLRLFDFEYGGYRHALLDGVYGRICFPTCWCVNRLPEGVTLQMEAAYRSELVKGCPEATDDRLFHEATVEVCATWLLWMLSLHRVHQLLQRDLEWGIATIRQRVLVRADVVVGLTRASGHLESVGETVASMARELRVLWPAEADAMRYYPAFR